MSTWKDLEDEILDKIALSLKGAPDLAALRLTCTSWSRAASSTVVEYAAGRSWTPELKHLHRKFPNLTHLDLNKEQQAALEISKLQAYKKLRSLWVDMRMEQLEVLMGMLAALSGLTALSLVQHGPYNWSHPGGLHAEVLLAVASLGQLRVLSLAGHIHLCDAEVVYLSALQKLQQLDMTGCQGLEGGFLSTLPSSLMELNLSSCRELEEVFLCMFLARLPALVMLNVSGTAVNGTFLLHSNDLRKLAVLEMQDCNCLLDEGLLGIEGLKGLTSLNLASCRGLSDVGLKNIARAEALKMLNLSCCSEGTDKGFANLSDLTQLTALNMHQCSMGKAFYRDVVDLGTASLEFLEHLTRLQSLNLGRCYNLSSESCGSLLLATQLVSLNLSNLLSKGSGGSEIIACILHELTGLTQLDLHDNMYVDDEVVSELSRMPKLQALNLERCRLLAAWVLEPLRMLCALTILNLARNEWLSDAGLEKLVDLDELQYLDVSFSRGITESGLELLCRPWRLKLREINLVGCGLDRQAAKLQGGPLGIRKLKTHKE